MTLVVVLSWAGESSRPRYSHGGQRVGEGEDAWRAGFVGERIFSSLVTGCLRGSEYMGISGAWAAHGWVEVFWRAAGVGREWRTPGRAADGADLT